MPPICLAICGVGTGVGKTHIGCAVAAELVRRGETVVAQKPVETGFSAAGSDAERLAEACGGPLRRPRYALREPVSPHLAARTEGVVIDVAEIARWIDRRGLAIVETAGGLLSPLGRAATNLDLLVRLDPDAIALVAVDRLGALHDVRAAALALAGAGLWARTTVALSLPQVGDAATGTNARELAWLGWAERVIEFPWAELADPRTGAAAAALAELAIDGPARGRAAGA